MNNVQNIYPFMHTAVVQQQIKTTEQNRRTKQKIKRSQRTKREKSCMKGLTGFQPFNE